MTTLCANCGFDNPPVMRFCGNCGTRLDEAAAILQTSLESGAELQPSKVGVLMGADLIERMQQAGLEAKGQRRNVTVLFADLSGYTEMSGKIDQEDLYEVVQKYVSLMSDSVYRYEGLVDKLTGDGIMALFGAPISHENNAERAVRAALDMQRDMRQLNRTLKTELGIELHARVGLHSGIVIVGSIGSNMMMDYTAIGDTVNLAHRIEEAASPGAILISETVYRQVRAFFYCQQISLLNHKGYSHPVIAYRVGRIKPQPGSVRGVEGLNAPMIGRDLELITLKKATLQLIEERKGQFLMITGEAGLGKSRLIAELKAWIDPKRVRILEGHSLAYRRTVPYWIIREAIYNYLGLAVSTPALQTSERLARFAFQAMGDHADEVIPFLENILSLPFSDGAKGDRLRHLDPRQVRQQTYLAVRDLLVAEASVRPVLLVLDDLHWADEASLDLLNFLLEAIQQAPILFLAISRNILPGLLEKIVGWASENLEGNFHHVVLQSLSIDQSKQLLHLLLSIPDLPERLREHIVERAAGIPFYLEEILRMLIDEGVIRSENGRWRVVTGVDISELGVPNSLQELIMARFDSLGRSQKVILQVASVIGKDFVMPVLSNVLASIRGQELLATMDTLVERGFISPVSGTHETEYSFRHILMSDAIYATILRKERNQLHGRVGEVMEAIYADRLEEQVELLANHYRWSPKKDRALHYLILAGQRAERNHINEQAREHYRAALELLEKNEHQPYQAYNVFMGMGDVLAFEGDYAEGRAHFQRALHALSGFDDSLYAREESILFRKIARTYERHGDYEQALEYLSAALSALDKSHQDHDVERAEVWHDVGWINFRRGNYILADELLQKALGLVETTDAFNVIASVYNRLGGVAYNLGNWEKAAIYLRKSINIRESIGDMVGLASSSNNLGNLEIEMGEFDNALEDLNRNYALIKRLGQAEGTAIAYNNLGWLHTLRGDVEAAREALNNGLELARQIGYSSLIREAMKNIGELHLACGEWEKAREVLSEVAPSFEEMGANDQLLYIYRLLGENALGANDFEEASGWAHKLDKVVVLVANEEAEIPALQRGELLRFRGMLAARMGNWDTAEENFSGSIEIFNNLRSHLYLGRTIFQMGLLRLARGQQKDAHKYLYEAMEIFDKIGARLDAERTKLALRNVQG